MESLSKMIADTIVWVVEEEIKKGTSFANKVSAIHSVYMLVTLELCKIMKELTIEEKSNG